jgi:hypothetical protein
MRALLPLILASTSIALDSDSVFYDMSLSTLDGAFEPIEITQGSYTKGDDFKIEVWLGTRSTDIKYLQFQLEGDQVKCDWNIKIGQIATPFLSEALLCDFLDIDI